jgi:hypothetical protein
MEPIANRRAPQPPWSIRIPHSHKALDFVELKERPVGAPVPAGQEHGKTNHQLPGYCVLVCNLHSAE